MATTGSLGKLVVRFGGKSLLDIDHVRQAADEIADLQAQGWSVAVVVAAMKQISDQLKSLSSSVVDEPNLREMDILISSGDQASAALLALALQAKGIQAMALTANMAGIQTDHQHGTASIRNVDNKLVENLMKQNVVPVLTGSYGISRQGQIATLGKGAADLVAVALAEAIHADRLEFFTDVDGIYSKNPKEDARARYIDFISYNELMHQAVDGGGVIHARALELAMARNVTIVVRGSGSEGTLVASQQACGKLVKLSKPRTVKPDIAVA